MGASDVADLLIQSGARVDARDSQGRTAPQEASFSGYADVVRPSLAVGADPNAADKKGQTALMLAAGTLYLIEGCPLLVTKADSIDEALRALLEAHPNPNAADQQGRTALMFAAKYGRTTASKELILAKSDLNMKDNEGRTALYLGLDSEVVEITELLRYAGASGATASRETSPTKHAGPESPPSLRGSCPGL